MAEFRRVRDISNLNFEESFPYVKETIESATFVAFDAEFTGIAAADVKQNSLFDTPKERYSTLRNNLKDYIISQFGLTAFQFERETNKYLATTFVFYLFPRAAGNLHRTFNTEASAFQFLAQYNFDFGKFLGNGVTYLREADQKGLHSGRPWLASAMRSRRKAAVSRPSLTRMDQTIDKDLGLSCKLQSGNLCLTDRFGQEDNVAHDLGPVTSQSVKPSNGKTGFCRVFRLLSDLKKPIVGHNAILDLMLMYNQLHDTLPENYFAFKREVHALFPRVFDTKFLSYELRDFLSRDSVWESNDLARLFKYFESGDGANLAKYSPRVELSPWSESNHSFHEAGWDSFCTGFCFVKIMHFFATQNNMGCGMEAKPLTSVQHLFSVDEYKNRINITRANVNNIHLAGKDPASKKPQWLVVEATNHELLDSSVIAEQVVRKLDLSMDIKQISHNQALIAVNYAGAARDLMQAFDDKTGFRLVPYNPLKHNRIVRSFLWVGIVSSGSVMVSLLLLAKRH